MAEHQTLVAISREPISEKLVFELKDRANRFGVTLHTQGIQISNRTYHSERWDCNVNLDAKQRDQLRSICSQYKTDLCFLKPDLMPRDIRILAMDMDSTLINIECIETTFLSTSE